MDAVVFQKGSTLLCNILFQLFPNRLFGNVNLEYVFFFYYFKNVVKASCKKRFQVPSTVNFGPVAPPAGCDVTKTIEATTSLPVLRRSTRFDANSSKMSEQRRLHSFPTAG